MNKTKLFYVYLLSAMVGFGLLIPRSTIAQQKINWISFEALSDALEKDPKPVLISFHAKWCSYCRKMQKEVFTDPEIIKLVNQDYYAVSFDVETRDTVWFDGQAFVNRNATPKREGFHDLALLLGSRKETLTVPVTLILNPDFSIKSRDFEYLSRKKLKARLTQ